MRAGGAVALATVVAIASGPLLAPPPTGATGPAARRAPGEPVARVLIVSVPGVRWPDVAASMPALAAFTERAGVGNLSVRAPKLTVDLAGSYVSLGAGDKSVGADRLAPGATGAAFGAGELIGAETAGAVYRRLTGRRPGRGLVHLGIGPTRNANLLTTFQARVGRLGDALSAAGWSRAVIANADAPSPTGTAGPSRGRDAVAALMSADGRVPAGRVDDGLLRPDPDAPFGVRLDEQAVLGAFSRVFVPRSVVLVEGSDLRRVEAQRAEVPASHHAQVRAAALDRTDRLLGRLLARTDPTRDLVLVLAPPVADGRRGLGLVALRAPGTGAGYLRSGTTQRTGHVQMMDVAPTVLEHIGLRRAPTMRGRPMRVTPHSGQGAARRAWLADVDEATRFRAPLVAPTAWVFIGMQVALMALTAAVCTGRAPSWGRRVVPVLASAALAVVPAVYLARLWPLHRYGAGVYWVVFAGTVAALTALGGVAGRRGAVDRLLVGLGLVAGVLLIDGVTGTRLQFNSALGSSPEAAGRFIGFNNAGYAALAASALLLAGLLTHRLPVPAGRRAAIGVLGVTFVVDAAPFWGADVGGALATAPAFGTAIVLLGGRRLRIRAAAGLVAATAGLVGLAAALDLRRPPDRRTHLARLVEQAQAEGIGEFARVVHRKLAMNLQSLLTSTWRVTPLVMAGFLLLLWRGRGRPGRAVVTAMPALRPTLVAFALLVTLGYALNDTGIQVPAIMGGMLAPTLGTLVVSLDAARTPMPAGTVTPGAGP